MNISIGKKTLLIAGVGFVSALVVVTMGQVVPLLTSMILRSDLDA